MLFGSQLTFPTTCKCNTIPTASLIRADRAEYIDLLKTLDGVRPNYNCVYVGVCGCVCAQKQPYTWTIVGLLVSVPVCLS